MRIGLPLLAAASVVPLAIGGLVVAALVDAPDTVDASGFEADAARGARLASSGVEGSTGVTAGWTSRLPGPVRWLANESQALAGRAALGIGSLWQHVTGTGDDAAPSPGSAATTPADRAVATLDALEREMGVRGSDGLFTEGAGSIEITSVWPHGQVVAAALDVALLTGDWSAANDSVRALAQYRSGIGYATNTAGAGGRYFDDNAWIGLDMMQAYAMTGDASYLAAAERIAALAREGVTPSGGVAWVEDAERVTVNTCTLGPTIELLLRLHMATGRQDYLDFARSLDGVLSSRLRGDDGLYVDHYGEHDGSVDEHVYSYNQGTPIGADVLWYRVTGDGRYLERARTTADAALRHFGEDDRLWTQAPAFNAVFFRNLLALDAVSPDPRYRALLSAYVDRAWSEARDPRTGLFTGGGVGRYGDAGAPLGPIDQAAFAQMYALLDVPAVDMPKIA